MDPAFPCRLTGLPADTLHTHLRGIVRGIEKESLRVTPEGTLSTRPHPRCLGSALTHPNITTDFSEALLELITRTHETPEAALDELDAIHRYVYHGIGEELLWATSMPCLLPSDHDIPVARYGTSNIGRMKTLYRIGLGHRYGRRMQTIAGTHYNFSLPDAFWDWYRQHRQSPLDRRAFRDDTYMGLIRNFRRFSWLLLYLLGASPAVCRSFVEGREHQLTPLGPNSFQAPYGTSLRMGDLGYQSAAQEQLVIDYNSLEGYIRSLDQALSLPHPEYERIGVRVDGAYRQLRDTLLQIENEFYSTVRPKRTTAPEQTPLSALAESGIEYIEVRCLDLDPFQPLGLDATTIRFLDTFLLYCLFCEAPPTDTAHYRRINRNVLATVYRGRDPSLTLETDSGKRSLTDWALCLLDGMQPIAESLDTAHRTTDYTRALTEQIARVHDPERTPSARVLTCVNAEQGSFFDFAMARSRALAEDFRHRPLPDDLIHYYRDVADASLEQQATLEAADHRDFETFLADYYAR